MIRSATRDDVIWLAGLAEGEATFDMQRRRYPRFRVSMCDRDVVGRVATLIGSSIRLTLKPSPASPIWTAAVQGPRAVEVMETLLPHLGARRSQKVAEILSAWRLSQSDKGKAYGGDLTRPPGLLSPAA